jgi:tetratricopeptide (TPR) repeat protein
VEDGDDPRATRAKVTGQILTLHESLQDTIPALLSLLDALPEDSPFLKLDPPQRRQRTLKGLKQILLRESQVQPLLLIFEDLHWIDSETQALLDSLIESLPTAQMLLLVNYRPEYQHDWSSKTFYTQLRLDPLRPESVDVFLEALLGDDPSLSPLKQLLIERTEGNPFFLEESVRTLVETEALSGEPGKYRLAQELPMIQVPATVQALLAARIDRLPPDAKQLLQTASVIDHEVPLSLLQAIAELSEDVLHRCLTHLQAAEFVYETSLFPDRIYTFKHALTHEVAYGSLLQARRRMLQARIVDVLESMTANRAEDHIDALAHHAFRGEVWDKALRYYRQAGGKARMRSAHREAVSCFEQALVALHRLPEGHDVQEQAIDLRLHLRPARLVLGQIEPLFHELQEAERLATVLGDQVRLGRVSLCLAFHFLAVGDFEQMLVYSQRAFDLASASQDTRMQAMTDIYLNYGYQRLGDFQRAIACCRRVIASQTDEMIYDRLDQTVYPSVLSRTFLAWNLAEIGQFAEGNIAADAGFQIAETAKHPASLMIAHLGIGTVSLQQGRLQMALPQLERAMAICQEADLPLYFSFLAVPLGAAYLLSGRITDALLLLEEAREQAMRIGLSMTRSGLLAGLADASRRARRLDAADTYAQEALALARTRKERGREATIRHLLGDIAMQHHTPEVGQAETHYQQALDLAEELGMHPLQAHCHRTLGTLYSQTDQSEQARVELSTAIAMYRDMAMTFWLPETEAALIAVETR